MATVDDTFNDRSSNHALVCLDVEISDDRSGIEVGKTMVWLFYVPKLCQRIGEIHPNMRL